MRFRFRVTCVWVILSLIALSGEAYQFRTHNGITKAARTYLRENPPTGANFDADFVRFLKDASDNGFGELIDSRAGNSDEHAWTDEDHNEGGLVLTLLGCYYQEGPCTFSAGLDRVIDGAPCTLDHFHPPLPAPLGREDAVSHAYYYVDLAYRLYVAGKCAPYPLSEAYFRGAAMALGHALHLLEDMNVPQHVRPENHGPRLLAGHGPSFYECRTQDFWDRGAVYATDGHPHLLGHFSRWMTFEGQMVPQPPGRSMMEAAESSRYFVARSPFSRGTVLGLADMGERFPGSFIEPTYVVDDPMDPPRLSGVVVWQYPAFARQSGLEHSQKRHWLFTDAAHAVAEPDFWLAGRDILLVESDEAALRLWAEPDRVAEDGALRPLEYHEEMKAHLDEAAGRVASVILWFWEQVRDVECPGPCERPLSPCGIEWGRPLRCPGPGPDFPIPPGGDTPDDNASVVGTAAVRAGGDEPLTLLFDRHWRQVGELGVRRRLPELVDLWKAMWLMEVAGRRSFPLDEASEALVREAVGRLEAQYSGAVPGPGEVIGRAPEIAVLENGFVGGMQALLERLGRVYALIPVGFDPVEAAAAYPVLLVPSGALYGMGGSLVFRARLAEYVERGGVLLVLGQMRGEDFAVVPVPSGERLEALGWLQDQSCTFESLALAARHPAVAWVAGRQVSVPVDGTVLRWPLQGTVLLRRTGGGGAAVVAYPLGEGLVVVSTAYPDWAEANGGASWDGRRLLGQLLLWAEARDAERPECRRGVPCRPVVTVEVANVSGEPADRVAWSVRDPGGNGRWDAEEALVLGPGETRTVTVTPELGTGPGPFGVGIVPVRYELRNGTRELHATDGQRRSWEVQPWATVGQVVVEDWPPEIHGLEPVSVAMGLPQEDWPQHAVVPVHLVVGAMGGAPAAGTVRLDYTRGPAQWGQWRHFGSWSFAALPGEPWELDVEVGPLDLTEGHGGLGGGGVLRAEVWVPGVEAPVATAFHSVLRNRNRLEVELGGDPAEAGPGDTVVFTGRLRNATMATFAGRYRLVVHNEYNVLGEPAEHQVWMPVRDFRVEPGETAEIGEQLVVPEDWQGTAEATLYFCFPHQGLPCWDDPDPRNGFSPRWYSAAVALPLPRGDVVVGQPEPLGGPAVRVPVTLRNTGPRAMESGRVTVTVWRESTTVDVPVVPPHEDRTVTVEVPLELRPGEPAERTLVRTVEAELMQEGVPVQPVRATARLVYGGKVWLAGGRSAPAAAAVWHLALRVVNPSPFPRTFTVDLAAQELGFAGHREVTVGTGQRVDLDCEIPVPAGLPYGRYPLQIAWSDGALIAGSRTEDLEYVQPRVPLRVAVVESPLVAGGQATLEIEAGPSAVDHPLPATLTVAAPDLGFSESRAVEITPGNGLLGSVAIPLPPDLTAGSYPFTVTVEEPAGGGGASSGELVLAPAEPVVAVAAIDPVAGGQVTYSVRNIGGVADTFSGFWMVRRGMRFLHSEPVSLTLAPAEVAAPAFTLPAQLASGRYEVTLALDGTMVRREVEVAGTGAMLMLATAKPVFLLGEALDGWADLANGPVELTGATLHLEVVDEHLRVRPWGVFQGSLRRTGAAPVSGPEGLVAQAWAGAGEATFFRAVAGDLEGDGFDDVVALEGWGAAPRWLTVYRGPYLDSVASAEFSAGAEAADAAVLDTDGDGTVEVYTADMVNSTLTVRRLDAGLATVWERELAGADATGEAYPAGGPVGVDLDGDGLEELVLSSGAGVRVLEAQDGAEVWSVTAGSGLPADGLVTGIAARPAGLGQAAVLVGLTDGSGGGGVAALGPEGAPVWSWDASAPVMGAPVLLGGPEGARAAVVATPGDPAASSTVAVLDLATGVVVWQAGVWLRSRFQPAAGDLDGDGTDDIVVATGAGAAAFAADGSLLWDASADGTGAGAPPVVLDMDGVGGPDVVVPRSDGWGGGRTFALAGTDGHELASAWEGAGPAVVLDAGGDWRAELFVASAYGGVLFGAGWNGPGGSGEAWADGRRALWSWEGPMELAADRTLHLDQLLSTRGETGQFLFRGELLSALGQPIARAAAPFAVTGAEMGLLIRELAPAYAPGETVTVDGTVTAPGDGSDSSVEARLLLDGAPVDSVTVQPVPGEAVSFTFQTAAPPPGSHTAKVELWQDGGLVAAGERLLPVEVPNVELSIDAPDAAGSYEFQVAVMLVNPTRLTLPLAVTLLPGGGGPRQVTLGPGMGKVLVFEREITADTTFIATVGGAAVAQASATVAFDAVPELAVTAGGDVPAGPTVLRVGVTNTGAHRWTGELTWRLEGGVTDSGTAPLDMAGGGSAWLDLPVDLPPGTTRLVADAGPAHAETTLAAHRGGIGTLELTVPSPVVEGEVPLSVTVTNTGQAAGDFAAVVTVSDSDGQEIVPAADGWTLAKGEVITAELPVPLGPGSYTVTAVLNGDPATAASAPLEVLPARQLTVHAAFAPPAAEATVPLQVTVTASGALPAPVVVDVVWPGGDKRFAGTVPRGETATWTAAVPAWAAEGATLTAEVRISDGAGQVDEVRTVSTTLAPAELGLVAAPGELAADAGGEATIPFELANAGMRPGRFELEVELAGGGVGRAVLRGTVSPRETRAVAAVVPIPVEAPSGPVEGRYRLLDCTGDPCAELASGFFPVRIRGVSLEVVPSLSPDHADPGGTVGLAVQASAPGAGAPLPLTARVWYGSWREERPLPVGPDPTSLSLEVPVDEPGGDVHLALLWPSGRAAFLWQRPVHAASGAVVLATDCPEYVPGDTVNLTATIPEGTRLEVQTPGGAVAFDGSGSETFRIPEGTPYGRYPLPWTLYGASPEDGRYDLLVRAPRVRLLRVAVAGAPLEAGEAAAAEVLVTADQSVDLVLEGALRAPDGSVNAAGTVPVQLEAGDLARVEVPFLVPETGPGTYHLGVAAVDPTGHRLARAQAAFDVGGAALLGVATDRPAYRPGQAVTATVTVAGSGPAVLDVLLDDAPVAARDLTLNGTAAEVFELGTPEPGGHAVRARFETAGGEAVRETTFEVVTAPIELTTEGVVAGAVVGRPYTAALRASGGAEPYAWEIGEGALPHGIALDSASGTLSGIPTEAGTFVAVTRVTDALGSLAVAGIRLTVAAAPLEIVTAVLPEGSVGAPYAAALEAAGGTPPYLWRVATGSLPEGVTVDASTGRLAGTPAQPGHWAVTFEALDSGGLTAERELEAVVVAQRAGIPAVGRWGMILLAGLIAVMGALALRQRW